MESIIELDKLQLAHHRAFNDVPEYEGAAKPKHFMGVLHFRQIIYPTLALQHKLVNTLSHYCT